MISSKTFRLLKADTNKNVKVTTEDMIYTLFINILLFIVFMITFEGCRHLKQVYLKRYQQRFEVCFSIDFHDNTKYLIRI